MKYLVNGIELHESEVKHIVNVWYLNSDETLHNEEGLDLEEILDVDGSEEVIILE